MRKIYVFVRIFGTVRGMDFKLGTHHINIFRTFPISNLKILSKSFDLVTLWTLEKLSSVNQKKVVVPFDKVCPELNHISAIDFSLSKISFQLLQIAIFSRGASPPEPPNNFSQPNSTSWQFYLLTTIYLYTKKIFVGLLW